MDGHGRRHAHTPMYLRRPLSITFGRKRPRNSSRSLPSMAPVVSCSTRKNDSTCSQLLFSLHAAVTTRRHDTTRHDTTQPVSEDRNTTHSSDSAQRTFRRSP
jgi:hypothetical protein